MKIRHVLLVCGVSAQLFAQLTTEQRLSDFRNLADLYARRYIALDWKRDAVKFDALNLAPWLQRVQQVKDDLDMYDLMVEYVASLNDAHDGFLLPSTFSATLGFTVDIYDGKVLVDSVNRDRLPADQFPFDVGDEVVSVDGKTVDELIAAFSKYAIMGNARATRRLAAEMITSRSQDVMPRAHEIGDAAAVVIKRQSGATETYNVPWKKDGYPVTVLGPSPGPRITASLHPLAQPASIRARWLDKLQHFTVARRRDPEDVIGFGRLAPVFALPDNFVQRLGKSRNDSYYSGTFESNGVKIGFIRIPDFEARSTRDFEREMTFFDANTDVLVIDIMRNPGGFVCTSGAEGLLSRITPSDFQGTAAELRVAWLDILGVKQDLDNAMTTGEDQSTIDQLQTFLTEFQRAFNDNRGRTSALPLCGADLNRSGRATAYTKPVLLLTDEFTASAGDLFSALFQDNRRGRVLGWRTAGAGGSPETDVSVGAYTEGTTSITFALVVRKDPIATPDFPTSAYIENVGIRPDKEVDYMTKDNLLNKGAAFVKAFTDEAVQMVKGQ